MGVVFEQMQPMAPAASYGAGMANQFNAGEGNVLQAAALAQRANLAGYGGGGVQWQQDRSSLLGQQGAQQRQLAAMAQQARMQQMQQAAQERQQQLAMEWGHADEIRMQKLKNALSYIDNEPTLDAQTKADLKTQVMTGINVANEKRQAAMAEQEKTKAANLARESQNNGSASVAGLQSFSQGLGDSGIMVKKFNPKTMEYELQPNPTLERHQEFAQKQQEAKQKAEEARWKAEEAADEKENERYLNHKEHLEKLYAPAHTSQVKNEKTGETSHKLDQHGLKDAVTEELSRQGRGTDLESDRDKRQLSRYGMKDLWESNDEKAQEYKEAFRQLLSERDRNGIEWLKRKWRSYVSSKPKSAPAGSITDAQAPTF